MNVDIIPDLVSDDALADLYERLAERDKLVASMSSDEFFSLAVSILGELGIACRVEVDTDTHFDGRVACPFRALDRNCSAPHRTRGIVCPLANERDDQPCPLDTGAALVTSKMKRTIIGGKA